MSVEIHPTAIVEPGAELADGVRVAPFAVIGPDVRIGRDTTVGPRATLEGRCWVGEGCEIGVGAVLGTPPQDQKYRGEDTTVTVGDRTRIREYATVHRGTAASGTTSVGADCLLMAYVHVGHDCALGDGVVLANQVQLAGHVVVEDFVYVGGLSPIHQFVRLGTRAYVGGGSRVPRDVPPYVLAAGNPLRLYGVNVEGLRRAGIDARRRTALKRAYRLLFNSDLVRGAAVEQVDRELGEWSEVQHLLDFVRRTDRGVIA